MSFIDTQKQFVAYLRDPQNNPAPTAVEGRLLAIYRRLIRNNVASFLSSGFPILKARTPAATWQSWVDAFLVSHQSNSPFFSEIGREFVSFLEQYENAQVGQLERELARYERMDVDAMFAHIPTEFRRANRDDIENQRWVVSPAAFLDQFHYPVTTLDSSSENPARQEHPQFILVYRPHVDTGNVGSVQFLELTPLTAVLLELLQQTPKQSLRELLMRLQPLLPQLESEQLEQGLRQILTDFAARSVLLVKA
ncbi:hypothetical protein C9927_02635 [Pseudidiomarina aestuarii]|uniref:Uncharacterized protein n=1 Tax=Pseudidiomarina aestuarii TaxID=624146 RepID=A0A2T4D5F0_9GAMM|nr:hypothetical protein C9988_01545 [Pseudidiomarina aestuarii]PTB89034.1 hypothetical protein C9927_02635 [Pseudidiomarina aestuarii]PTB89666.1 hypothetical protein C9928_02715 [Pseudidiomarina aestuarii]